MDLAEFDRIRDETDNRTTLSSSLINYDIVLIGGSLAAYDKLPAEVMLAIAAASSMLWMMWIDHTSQIYKLASYIELGIAPRLRRHHPDVLSWEAFVRDFDDRMGRLVSMRTTDVNYYISLVFGGGAVLLLAAYATQSVTAIITALRAVARASGLLTDPTPAVAVSTPSFWSRVTQQDPNAWKSLVYLGLLLLCVVLLIAAFRQSARFHRMAAFIRQEIADARRVVAPGQQAPAQAMPCSRTS